jgi:hypothetical protein
MSRARVAGIASVVGATLSLAGVAGAAVPTGVLVAHPAELPGFATAKVKIRSASTPYRYAKVVLEDKHGEAMRQAAKLSRKGFREGVSELLSGSSGEALSVAVVFRTRRSAREEFKRSLAETLKAQGKAPIERVTVGAIPGAYAFSVAEPGQPGGAANVLFASGRCYFLIGNFLRSAPAQQLSVAPIAGATAVYQRSKRLCAH